MTVGERIKERRLALNLSQGELAKKVGYKSRSSINKIELARDLPLKKVTKMAVALDCSPSYLMGWDEDENVSKLINAYEHSDFINSITDNEIELLKRIRALEAVYTKEQIERGLEFIALYQNAIPEIQTAVDSLLKSQKRVP